jgi:transcriptional regulator with XRE-family HTH domain
METASFGPLLRRWRQVRKLSQERLADEAEISTRHLSCLENERSKPSREMVLVLSSALEVPLRERNLLLAAAGFAAVYRETPLESPAMDHVRHALDHLLEQSEPYGAVVLDRRWNLLRANRGAARLLGAFFDPTGVPPQVAGNIMHAVCHPQGLRPHILNWERVSQSLIHRLQRDALDIGGDDARELLAELAEYPGLGDDIAAVAAAGFEAPDVLLPLHLKHPEQELRFFTTLTTLGTPLDVTAQELRIESYFPADDATREFAHRSAGG